MKALLRTLLLWFLLAGVPLQGFATATMLLCGPGAVSAAVPAMAQQVSGTHAAGHHDHHDHVVLASAAAAQHGHAAGHDGAGSHHQGVSHADHVKCASAGACCTGAPLAPSMPATPLLQDGRGAPVPFVSTAPAAVDLAGLERPPKFPTA
ncbi:MAG TPA: hypothetical protein VF774_16065 [Pseudoduganella sp.]